MKIPKTQYIHYGLILIDKLGVKEYSVIISSYIDNRKQGEIIKNVNKKQAKRSKASFFLNFCYLIPTCLKLRDYFFMLF